VSEEQAVWELWAGSDLLGKLLYTGWDDFPWHGCDFQPTPAFERFRPLFDEYLRLVNKPTSNDPDFEDFYMEHIAALELKFVPIGGNAQALRNFVLLIEGNRVRFKYWD
jgi:hypothetical protein